MQRALIRNTQVMFGKIGNIQLVRNWDNIRLFPWQIGVIGFILILINNKPINCMF